MNIYESLDGIAAKGYDAGVAAERERLRTQVQQARDDYNEVACDHSDMTGHGAQEERAWGAVQALDEVLQMLDGEC